MRGEGTQDPTKEGGLLFRVAISETHRQPDAVAAGVVAEHIAGYQPGAGHYDVVLAAVEFYPEP